MNKRVFFSSALVITTLLLYAALLPSNAKSTFDSLQAAIITNGSWFYVLTVAIILIYILYLAISRNGEIKLGLDHEMPEYSLPSWLSMLFAAGMGIGLMFFGVAEPLMHYLAPPNAEPESIDAMRESMKITFFHWGLHAWAIYAIVALILAYFSYRHRLPLTLRSALYPLIGEKIYSWRGNLVDIFAVVSTVFGVATSLGLGASQVNSGLNYLFGFEVSVQNQIIIMVAIIGLASISVATGLDKGIKILSETNMVLAIGLLLIVFFVGPTIFLLQAYLQNMGAYISDIITNTFNLFAYQKTDWIGGWTIFYWGWWLAWAPFVGMFIARISKGRTIREFIIGVMLVPTAFTLLWMTIFGNSAIALVADDVAVGLADIVNKDVSVALFYFMEQMPLSNLLSFLSVLIIVVFFVTSCDSGAMVVDMLCSNGSNDTPVWQRLFWAITIGLLAIVLLFAGGLQALQTMTIAAALPFAIVLLLALWGLMQSLKVEATKQITAAITPAMAITDNSGSWKEQLDNMILLPQKSNVRQFVQSTVFNCMTEISEYLTEKGMTAKAEHIEQKGAKLIVQHGDELPFVYAVYMSKHSSPIGHIDEEIDNNDQDESYFRADVHLTEGGQGYDIMGWSTQAIRADILNQYQNHLHFLHELRS